MYPPRHQSNEPWLTRKLPNNILQGKIVSRKLNKIEYHDKHFLFSSNTVGAHYKNRLTSRTIIIIV